MSKLDLSKACVSTEAMGGWKRKSINVDGKVVAWISTWKKMGSETGVILDGKKYAHVQTYLKTGYYEYVPDTTQTDGVFKRPLVEGSEEFNTVKAAIDQLKFDLPVCTR